jgi:hypothetical protein
MTATLVMEVSLSITLRSSVMSAVAGSPDGHFSASHCLIQLQFDVGSLNRFSSMP